MTIAAVAEVIGAAGVGAAAAGVPAVDVPAVDVAGLDVAGVDVAGVDVAGVDVAGLDVAGHPASPPTDTASITSVEFDSRNVRPGALFVALRGDRVDGHDFAAAAERAGALAVLGSRPMSVGIPALILRNEAAVLAALAALAGASVAELITHSGLTVIGVTGSTGKTSTKDMIAAILTAAVLAGSVSPGSVPPGSVPPGSVPPGAASVIAPPNSFNNEIGHPYTVLRADSTTRYLVLELSARGPGHIAALAAVAPPRIGAVLNVGSAHVGEFGSVAAIAAAKGELVEALPAAADGGVAILNADDPLVAAMASRTAATVVTTGVAAGATVRATGVSVDGAAMARFTLVTPEGSAPVALRVVGAHQVGNALAAAAVGRALGVGVDAVARALSAAEPVSHWRMEVSRLPGGVTLINDAYNANPESMRAALNALMTIGANRRTWAVLGEMAELGDATAAANDEIGALAVRLGVDRLLTVGPAARPLHLAARLAGFTEGQSADASDADAALAILRSQLRPGDVVLVKASRSVGLERLALALASGEGGDR